MGGLRDARSQGGRPWLTRPVRTPCIAEVYGVAAPEPCGNPGKVEHRGAWFCGIHNPVRKAKKDAERKAERDARWAKERARMLLGIAAPDLLAACKLTAQHFERNYASGSFQCDEEHEAWNALRAAIAKAEPNGD